jgi:2-oxo-3-hexenedioate decarboxylase
MTNQSDLDAIAREMKIAQDQCQQLEPFTSRHKDFGNTEAYAVANLIHEMRVNEGAVLIGRKIGFTNPNIWPTYGVYEPIWGHVYDTTLIKASGPAIVCKIGRFAEPRIEPEVVVHFRSAPPVTDDLAEILACVDWVAHGIEIVQSHFPGWKFQAADTVADSGLHGALIVGEAREVTELAPTVISDLERFTVTLSCNGDECEQGKGSNALGGPLRAVAHLISTIAKQAHPVPLQAGEVVTTGTLTAAFPIQVGQTWSTHLDGISLQGLAVSLED